MVSLKMQEQIIFPLMLAHYLKVSASVLKSTLLRFILKIQHTPALKISKLNGLYK